MKNTTLLLPGFHLSTLRRKPRSAKQKLIDEVQKLKERSLSQLGECFGKLIPKRYLAPDKTGKSSRRRIFCKENTFWAFFSQILDADSGCQEVLRKVQAFASMSTKSLPSSSTSAYCQARKRLDISTLDSIFQHTSDYLQAMPKAPTRLMGRRVIVVDGTGLSMPDTPENQEKWPQPANLTPGCAFPQARLCGCFCLQTGAVLSYEVGNRKSSELPMLRKQWDTFKPNDIFLGDKLFCSYYDLSNFQKMDVDSVVTLARRKPINKSEALKVLGKDDLLIQWKKPVKNKTQSYSHEEWESLPETLTLRQIKITVDQQGFRVKSFYIITTLLEDDLYSANELADLYFQRWDVELFFRDIKITMGMDVLRCKTPDMIYKEIIMYLIVYNCIRCLMYEAAMSQDMTVRRISFKGSMQALRQWESQFNQVKISREQRVSLMALLIESMASYIVPERIGRREPRAVKRRRKNFQLLTKPRHEFCEIPHRSSYRAKAA